MQREPGFLAATLLLLASGACAPTVQLERPPVLQSQAWRGIEGSGTAISGNLAAMLGMEELRRLTALALAGNSGLGIAKARIAQSRALLHAARKATLPRVSASAGASRKFNLGGGNPLDFTNSFGSLDIALDLDLFGRLGAAKRSAAARARVAELQHDAVVLAVEGSVAEAFVQRAGIAQRIAILENSIVRASELERVIRLRFDAGDANRVDLGLQTIQRMNLRSDRSRLAQALDQTRTALAILTGAEAPQFESAAASLDAMAVPQLLAPPPPTLLAARPDVRAAEAAIEAANGDVAQARANFFPVVSLSASGLLESAVGGALGRSVNLASSVLAPIFSQGRLQSEFRFASAAQAESVERYRLAIVTALAEVEDIRSAVAASGERASLLDLIVAEARLTARLANMQYIEGEEGLQALLNAEQWLSDAEEAQALSRQERLFAQIALYRAMGGSSAPR